MGLNFNKNVLIQVRFTSELKNFVTYCVFLAKRSFIIIVLHVLNLTYYSNIILGSFSILLFPKLCWNIGLTPNDVYNAVEVYNMYDVTVYFEQNIKPLSNILSIIIIGQKKRIARKKNR